jgi:hypothetical protein
MGRIAGFPGDSKRKRGDTAEKSGDLPEKLNRVRSLSLFGGGIQRKPRVIRGAHKRTPADQGSLKRKDNHHMYAHTQRFMNGGARAP